MKKTIIACLLIALLMAGITAKAGGEVFKDEVVYARLSATGEVLQTYVVNAFESDLAVKVSDYGAYDKAIALSAVEGFAYQDGEASFNMQPGRFSYQGVLTDKVLPWDISFSYTLDGKPMAPEDLSGASGMLEATIQVKVNEEKIAYAKDLSLQMTVTLNGDKARSIQADKATYALAGGNRTLSYVVLPGQEASYTFSAQVQDFSMAGIQIAAVRMGMDSEMYQNVANEALAGSPMQSAVSGFMGSFLASMTGNQPKSYTDSRNTVRTLQFILMSEGIAAPKLVQTEVPETAPETIWDRFMQLFGG